ncbi:hypothetical protein [Streptomyces sp. NPDC048242]|uniref:hypothetical protein n=1 Tax=Streptomyces sp. NPDC048242 TaxID=3155026 RepID=UPI0034269ACA
MATVLTIPTRLGHAVDVTANPDSSLPYSWACTAGDGSASGYASLPFARDDAQTHANTCQAPA